MFIFSTSILFIICHALCLHYRHSYFNFLNAFFSFVKIMCICAWMCRLRILLASRHEDFVTARQHTHSHSLTLHLPGMQTRNLCCWQLKLACNAIIYFIALVGIYENPKVSWVQSQCENCTQSPKHTACMNFFACIVLKIVLEQRNSQSSPPTSSTHKLIRFFISFSHLVAMKLCAFEVPYRFQCGGRSKERQAIIIGNGICKWLQRYVNDITDGNAIEQQKKNKRIENDSKLLSNWKLTAHFMKKKKRFSLNYYYRFNSIWQLAISSETKIKSVSLYEIFSVRRFSAAKQLSINLYCFTNWALTISLLGIKISNVAKKKCWVASIWND